MTPIQKRYDFAYIFDVTNGNPNGDPDAGNSPRLDPETGHGLVSDVCLKRKIRNYVMLSKSQDDGTPENGYDIYVKEKAILNEQHKKAYDALGLKKDTKGAEREKTISDARAWMCQNFFDIRAFGAVMSTDVNAGQVRGPVQLAFSSSVEPILTLDQAITRMAVTKVEDKDKERTIGRKSIVPYGLYVAHGFISPQLAAQTGFSDADLELLWQALKMMFEDDRSAARGEMAPQKLIVFEHDSKLGSHPAHKLFDRVQISRRDQERPARKFSDYDVNINRDNIPSGITIREEL